MSKLEIISILFIMPNDSASHYLIGHYTTHQTDGVHIEAHCTCGMKLEGIGQNEIVVMSSHFDVENHNYRFLKKSGIITR